MQRETKYREDLRHRLDSNQKHDSEVVIPRIPLGNDQFRDSLGENGYNDQHNVVRDPLEPEGYGNLGNTPPNPFGQGRSDKAGYLNQREERPDFVDDNDTTRMELLHPQEPKVDYVEENKFTYGLSQNKSYKTIKVKEKEAEQKLTEFFMHPKKPVKKHKQTIPLANEERRPPFTELRGNNAVGAEGAWAKRSAQLAKQKDSKQKTGSGSITNQEANNNIQATVDFNSHQIKDKFAKAREECMVLLLVISISNPSDLNLRCHKMNIESR